MAEEAGADGEEDLRARYVDQLVRLLGPVEPAVEQAFRTVDRSDFVTGFFIRQGTRWSWLPADSRPLSAEAAEWVYGNRPLVTVVGLNGMPASSSSMPSLMMVMLDALAVEGGMRVLEIGTGTGYNAALLSRIVGTDGQVVTVEADEDVAALALSRLGDGGFGNVVVVSGDGAEGYRPGAPYDRIVATAGCRAVPDAWWEQLADDGRVLVPLSHGATYPLTELRRGGERGRWTGRYTGHANFMGATGSGLSGDHLPFETLRLSPEAAVREEELPVEPARLDDLLFFVALDVPEAGALRLSGGSLGRKLVAGVGVRDSAGAGAALLCGRSLHLGGAADDAAERLRQAIRRWRDHGEPGLDRYRVRLGMPDQGGPDEAAGAAMSWRFPRGRVEQVVSLVGEA